MLSGGATSGSSEDLQILVVECMFSRHHRYLRPYQRQKTRGRRSWRTPSTEGTRLVSLTHRIISYDVSLGLISTVLCGLLSRKFAK